MGMENYIYIMTGKKKIDASKIPYLAVNLAKAGIIKEVNYPKAPFFSISQGKDHAGFAFELETTVDFVKKMEEAIKKDNKIKLKDKLVYFQWFHFYFSSSPNHFGQYDKKGKEIKKIMDVGFAIQICIPNLWDEPANVLKVANKKVVPIFEKTLGIKAQVEYCISY